MGEGGLPSTHFVKAFFTVFANGFPYLGPHLFEATGLQSHGSFYDLLPPCLHLSSDWWQ